MRLRLTKNAPRALDVLGRFRVTSSGLILLLVLVAVGRPRPAEAQGQASPIPAFTGERVYVSGVADEYGPLRDDIARLERTSPQTYYVVVVRSTGADKRST